MLFAFSVGSLEIFTKITSPISTTWRNDVIDTTDAILEILNNNEPMTDINKTFITLIPKIKNPENVTQFRPISLCNVFYKIFSKTLANRIRNIMNDIISPNQGAIIKGRNITNNIIITHELLKYMKTNKNQEYNMALKLYMNKAYGRVEWNFLEKLLEKMSFNKKKMDRLDNELC